MGAPVPSLILPSLFLVVALMPIGERQTIEPSSRLSPTALPLSDCIRASPAGSGQFPVEKPEDRNRHPSTGRVFQTFMTRDTEWSWQLGGKRFTVRGGLWPAANVAAQAGALDPAQDTLARQPGGASSGTAALRPVSWTTRRNRVSAICQ